MGKNESIKKFRSFSRNEFSETNGQLIIIDWGILKNFLIAKKLVISGRKLQLSSYSGNMIVALWLPFD